MLRRLLIVDDEPNLLAAIAAVLRDEGFEVATARNGKDALMQLARFLPDIVVSDIRMPVMDGYKLARQLRSAPHTKLIPIIFLSAKGEIADRIEGFRSGTDVYLTKPFEPDELIAVINSILQRVERTRTAMMTLIKEQPIDEPEIIRDEELTDSEWRVAECVAKGMSNKEIAADLGLSPRTIENHIGRILAKKNFSNRVEIARHVLSNPK